MREELLARKTEMVSLSGSAEMRSSLRQRLRRSLGGNVLFDTIEQRLSNGRFAKAHAES